MVGAITKRVRRRARPVTTMFGGTVGTPRAFRRSERTMTIRTKEVSMRRRAGPKLRSVRKTMSSTSGAGPDPFDGPTWIESPGTATLPHLAEPRDGLGARPHHDPPGLRALADLHDEHRVDVGERRAADDAHRDRRDSPPPPDEVGEAPCHDATPSPGPSPAAEAGAARPSSAAGARISMILTPKVSSIATTSPVAKGWPLTSTLTGSPSSRSSSTTEPGASSRTWRSGIWASPSRTDTVMMMSLSASMAIPAPSGAWVSWVGEMGWTDTRARWDFMRSPPHRLPVPGRPAAPPRRPRPPRCGRAPGGGIPRGGSPESRAACPGG